MTIKHESEKFIPRRIRHTGDKTGVAPSTIWETVEDWIMDEAIRFSGINMQETDLIFSGTNVWEQVLYEFSCGIGINYNPAHEL